MKKLLKYTLLLLALVTFVGCDEDEIIEPVSPLIKGQSIISGAVEVPAEPQNIVILFDREVRLNDVTQLIFTPNVPVELLVEGSILTIQTLENMAYETDYQMVIGEGVVTDAKTGGENLERVICFRTEDGPHIPPTEPTRALVNENATSYAQSLYTFLWDVYGTSVLSGSMAVRGWDLYESEWIKEWVGVYPAIASFDYQYLHLSPSTTIDYSNTYVVEKWWYDGGIVAIDWHWMVPVSEGARQYTLLHDNTTLTVANMLTEGTWENEQMMKDFEEVADMLLMLQEADVPVIWRPMPESQNPAKGMVGGSEYYWWSGASKSEYKTLWRRMFDYFQERGVNNLIWVWTSQVYDIEFYPGDEYVDMVALDLYNHVNTNTIVSIWNKLYEYFPHKILSLGEMGNLPTMGQQFDSRINWGYFVTHSDLENDLTESVNHSYATIKWWRECVADDRVLTRASLLALKSYQAVRAK